MADPKQESPGPTIELDERTLKLLQSPFDKGEEKQRESAFGKTVTYVDARAVMNRLDDIAGAKNWSTEFVVLHVGEPGVRIVKGKDGREREVPFQRVAVECRLTVLGVTKADAGQAEPEEEPFKSAYSDAFKRAAVHFGVGRYLYAPTVETRPQRPMPQATAVPQRQASVSRVEPATAPAATDTASAAQVRFIFSLGKDHAIDEIDLVADCVQRYGIAPEGLTRRQASNFIHMLQGKVPAAV